MWFIFIKGKAVVMAGLTQKDIDAVPRLVGRQMLFAASDGRDRLRREIRDDILKPRVPINELASRALEIMEENKG